jgi:hypothetical protein
MKFRLPSPELVEAYESTKSDYTDDQIQNLLKRVREENQEAEAENRSPVEIGQEIIDEGRVDEFISEASGGEYFDRDILKNEYGVSDSESKRIKKHVVREADLDVM